MKKSYSLIALLLIISMLTLTFSACKPKDDDTKPPVEGGGETEDGGNKDDKEDGQEQGGGAEVLSDIKIYMVGDSTVCEHNDLTYYYPRYGYGTQLGGYLSDKATVVNLAISGRSSKSFTTESEYSQLKNELKEGDYLIIGFGHNDEKSDDSARFTDASKPYTEAGSFGHSLYENYIKLAQEKGAIPILCTPIVRLSTSDDYSGTNGHVTATGDYAKAIIDLGAALNVPVIDLTAITKAKYTQLGSSEARYYHAFTQGRYESDGTTVVVDINSLDGTHLNIYGAKFVAYSLATELKKLDGIGKYVLANIAEPTKTNDLVPMENYEVPGYSSPVLTTYQAPDHFKTLSEDWYGTAFGSTGGDPAKAVNGYYATETEAGVFKVGQSKPGSNKGKFSSGEDGFAYVFRQIEADKNFIVSVTATVKTAPTTNQVGFGLMLRDDAYLPINSKAIISNYLTAGVLTGTGNATALFYRETLTLNKGVAFADALPVAEDTYEMKIERVGQSVTVTVIHGEETFTQTFVDFDLFAVDQDYMYVGMFANRGTIVEFTNLSFEITGTSQGA